MSYFANVLFYILFIICVNTAFPVFVNEKLNHLLLNLAIFLLGGGGIIDNKQCMYKVCVTHQVRNLPI